MGLGNIICQVLADKRDLSTIDYVRVARYASFGFFVSVIHMFLFVIKF